MSKNKTDGRAIEIELETPVEIDIEQLHAELKVDGVTHRGGKFFATFAEEPKDSEVKRVKALAKSHKKKVV